MTDFVESRDELFNVLGRYANNPENIPTLNYAVKMGDERAIAILLEHGMDINKPSYLGTPLQIAAKQNDVSIMRLLIQKKAVIDCLVFDLIFPKKYSL